MQAVIFAAGKGIRMRPLTNSTPKSLLSVGDTSILEHNLSQLAGLVNEVILVVGYKGEMIESKLGDSYGDIKIKYVWQSTQKGTGDAALQAAPFLDESCLFLNGDDLYHKDDIAALLKIFPAIMVAESEHPENFGVITTNGNRVIELLEKPENPTSKLVNTGAYHLPSSILKVSIQKSVRGEYEFTDYVKQVLQNSSLFYSVAEKWFPIATPESLDAAENFLTR
ncbi:MAG: sugar phosphate nucleotidyltransferase [Patescibacteria group bacterium]|nr:sugar phosphate nucleotidyltransferase [Patescibacteria group bacterium]